MAVREKEEDRASIYAALSRAYPKTRVREKETERRDERTERRKKEVAVESARQRGVYEREGGMMNAVRCTCIG